MTSAPSTSSASNMGDSDTFDVKLEVIDEDTDDKQKPTHSIFNDVFAVDMSSIPTVPKSEDEDLKKLDIEAYNIDILEENIKSQVDLAIKKEIESTSQIQKDIARKQRLKRKHAQEEGEAISENEEGDHEREDDVPATISIEETELEKKIRLGEVTPFGTSIVPGKSAMKVNGRRGRVGSQQKIALVDYIFENRSLDSDKFYSIRGKREKEQAWIDLAVYLNGIGPAEKPWKMWRQTWVDLKQMARKRHDDVIRDHAMSGELLKSMDPSNLDFKMLSVILADESRVDAYAKGMDSDSNPTVEVICDELVTEPHSDFYNEDIYPSEEEWGETIVLPLKPRKQEKERPTKFKEKPQRSRNRESAGDPIADEPVMISLVRAVRDTNKELQVVSSSIDRLTDAVTLVGDRLLRILERN